MKDALKEFKYVRRCQWREDKLIFTDNQWKNLTEKGNTLVSVKNYNNSLLRVANEILKISGSDDEKIEMAQNYIFNKFQEITNGKHIELRISPSYYGYDEMCYIVESR